jgi:hypothetical protein
MSFLNRRRKYSFPYIMSVSHVGTIFLVSIHHNFLRRNLMYGVGAAIKEELSSELLQLFRKQQCAL